MDMPSMILIKNMKFSANHCSGPLVVMAVMWGHRVQKDRYCQRIFFNLSVYFEAIIG